MVVTISKRAPWNLGKQMLQIFPEPCEKCGLRTTKERRRDKSYPLPYW
ncbi:MAG: hypothetical protein AAF443_08675 [Chlamydiota bacterium]